MKKGLKKLVAGVATAMALAFPISGTVTGGQEAKAWHKIDFDTWWDQEGKYLFPEDSYDTMKNSVNKVHGNSMGVSRPISQAVIK